MTTIRADLLKPYEWLKYLTTALMLSFVLAVAIPFTFAVLEEHWTPRDYWFTYHEVRPTKQVFQVGEPITFYSVREVRKTAKFEWNDTLRCDTNGVDGVGERTFSIYEAGKVLEPHNLGFPGGIWTYNAPVPLVPATCYLISTTTAKLRYADKVQTLKSEKFTIQ